LEQRLKKKVLGAWKATKEEKKKGHRVLKKEALQTHLLIGEAETSESEVEKAKKKKRGNLRPQGGQEEKLLLDQSLVGPRQDLQVGLGGGGKPQGGGRTLELPWENRRTFRQGSADHQKGEKKAKKTKFGGTEKKGERGGRCENLFSGKRGSKSFAWYISFFRKSCKGGVGGAKEGNRGKSQKKRGAFAGGLLLP